MTNFHDGLLKDTPGKFGYKILHNESFGDSVLWPWLLSIGDNIGLFPIVYGDRMRYADENGDSFSPVDDLYIVEETVKKYIFGYPWHLDDGTISRPYSWWSEGLAEFTGQVNLTF